jgi:glucose-6-phosphate 1-epimerase
MIKINSENRIERLVGPGGFPFVRLSHHSGYSTTVSEYGGQILSWMSPEEREFLFVSSAAIYQNGKAIRGGIPVCFPQFGKGSLPQHGFARTKRWSIVREHVSTTDAVSITLRLTPDSAIEAVWPHRFVLELDVVVTDVLLTALRVMNVGEESFEFTAALHTYFRTSDISTATLTGLRGIEYLDFLKDRARFLEARSGISFVEPIDRAYSNSPDTLLLSSPADGVRFRITKEGFQDSVVWNPWIEGNQAITDLGPNEYRNMVCVESGNVLSPVTVEPRGVHISGQVLRAEPSV